MGIRLPGCKGEVEGVKGGEGKGQGVMEAPKGVNK